MPTDDTIQALQREREGYVRRGLKNRVAEVDQALAVFGVAVTDDNLETTDATPAKPSKTTRKR